jgi:hypothetical protein
MQNIKKSEMIMGLAIVMMAIFMKMQHDKSVKLQAELSLKDAMLKSKEKDVIIESIREKEKEVRGRKIQPTSKSASEFWNELYK